MAPVSVGGASGPPAARVESPAPSLATGALSAHASGDVCTRFGGLHPPRGRNGRIPGQVCTRFGGLHPARGRNRSDRGPAPPSRVQTPEPGAQLPSRSAAPVTGAQLPPQRGPAPPPRVQTPATGAQLPARRRNQPPPRVQTPATGAQLPARRRNQPPQRVQTPATGVTPAAPSRAPTPPSAAERFPWSAAGPQHHTPDCAKLHSPDLLHRVPPARVPGGSTWDRGGGPPWFAPSVGGRWSGPRAHAALSRRERGCESRRGYKRPPVSHGAGGRCVVYGLIRSRCGESAHRPLAP